MKQRPWWIMCAYNMDMEMEGLKEECFEASKSEKAG